MKTLHLIISGRVQGVYFRAFTQKQAIKRDITGFVCNKNDGSVEVLAQANEAILDDFIKACYKGSILSKVDHITVKTRATPEVFSLFEIR
ncbi:MAG: acylphosphatase [Methylococcales bacterium]|nr:acylphosphatase [Methylococcales bacterium]